MKKIVLLALFGALASTAAHAATIVAVNSGSPTTVNSISVGTTGLDGTSTDAVVGYDFFATQTGTNAGDGTDIQSTPLPAFVDSITSTAKRFGAAGSYTTITIGGTAYTGSGVAYESGASGNPQVSAGYIPLATINLNAGTPLSFTLSLLGDNTNDPGNLSLYQVSLYSSTNVLLVGPRQINSTIGTNTTNDFYSATISGAGAGDYLSVAAETNPSAMENATLGGVVISTATTPEPSTYALMGAGLGLLVLVQRLRRHNA